jgi:hypothetical protein
MQCHCMSRAPSSGAARAGRTWPDRLWAVFAGIVLAVGLFGGYLTFGASGLLLGYLILSLMALVGFWGLSQEFAIGRPAVVRLSQGAALWVLVLYGLCELSPRYGWALAVLVALGSPWTGRLVARLRRRLARRGAEADLVDPEQLDRRFDDIVNRLGQPGDHPEV